MQFDPAGGRSDGLSTVFRAPALHKAHTDRAHTRQLVNRLEALRHRLREQRRELLVVEDFQIASCDRQTNNIILREMVLKIISKGVSRYR